MRSPKTAAGVAKVAAPHKRSQRKTVDKKSNSSGAIAYNSARGVDEFVKRIANAAPMELIDIERGGVNAKLIKDLAIRIEVPAARVCEILGASKATIERRAAKGAPITGAVGLAALGVVRLLAKAQAIADNSSAPEARGFDVGRWLGQWIERPQPALGGRKPAEIIATPTGTEVLLRLLGAMESGAYQ